MTPAALYVLAAMCAWIAPRDWQRHDYDLIAQAIVDATPDPEDEIQLAAIASYESRFAVHAVGKLHEQGPWQHRDKSSNDSKTTFAVGERAARRP
jgi:hypothetical protein